MGVLVTKGDSTSKVVLPCSNLHFGLFIALFFVPLALGLMIYLHETGLSNRFVIAPCGVVDFGRIDSDVVSWIGFGIVLLHIGILE